MNDMTPAGMGHNLPPDPIELVLSEHDGTITEAQNWADGELVADEAAMNAVDAVLKDFKAYKTALGKAAKERTDPPHKAWKAEVAAVKVYTDDADAMQKSLVACVAPFKEKLADEKREAERKAWGETERLRREAEEKARTARDADIEAQREVAAARQAAIDAENAAKATAKEAPKGMRTVTKWEITDYSDMLRWMNKHDRPALEAFCNDYARRCHKNGQPITGLRTWTEKEAY